MSARILIVDDEPSIRKVLAAQLKRFGFEVTAAHNGQEAVEYLSQDAFHLVISDLRMPGLDGMGLLEWCCEEQPGLPIILITAHGTVATAVEALKRGASDYISKPFDRDELHQAIQKALATGRADTQTLQESNPGARFRIIGSTPAMRDVYKLIEKVAPSPTTILIAGESGTGKELVARALHEHSHRSDAPFVRINCGAIPENLFESELFGYEKGAFTGAVQSKPGRFELAHGGTLFLDEVSELPKEMQVKLLRALQEGVIDRVGSVSSTTVDVRVIAASNIDLQQAVDNGDFREDLFYRLNVIPIHLPPLSSRVDDIPLLIEHFLEKFNARLEKNIKGVEPGVLAALMEYHWPGNIRELENLMERTILLTDSETLRADDLPTLGRAGSQQPAQDDLDSLDLKAYVRVHTVKLERNRIQRALDVEDGNVTRAARRLGISRKSLQMKMKDYELREAP